MKHTERVIKTQTPTTAEPVPGALITVTVSGYLNPLCCSVMCARVPVVQALGVFVQVCGDKARDTHTHTAHVDVCVSVQEISMKNVLLTFLCLPLVLVHPLCSCASKGHYSRTFCF